MGLLNSLRKYYVMKKIREKSTDSENVGVDAVSDCTGKGCDTFSSINFNIQIPQFVRNIIVG